MQFLSEHLNPVAAALREQRTGKDLFLNGIMMQAEQLNGNGRKYPKGDIERAVHKINEQIKGGATICGELEHPPTLSIDLKNVSHIITEAWMDGNNAMGKMKILPTPSGNIVKALVEGGVRLGVSSRGTGNVNESGIVSDFDFITMDVVATPSAPNAFPNPVYESMNSSKIVSLAEAVNHDPAAQKFLKEELSKIFRDILLKR